LNGDWQKGRMPNLSKSSWLIPISWSDVASPAMLATAVSKMDVDPIFLGMYLCTF